MVLKGDLRSISLVSLLQMIEGERKTGVLNVETGKFSRKIFLSEGKILSLISNDPFDLFGHFLVSKGFIDEKTLADAMAHQTESKQLIGAILGAMANLPEDKIKEQLTQKLQESFYHLFLLDDAAFEFHEEPIDMTQFPGVAPMGVQSLLMEGMRRMDEYKRLKGIFTTPHQSFVVNREKTEADLSQQGSVQKILDLLEAGATIEDLCLNFHTYDYTIFHYLEPLLSRGILTKGAVKARRVVSDPGLKPTGVLMEVAQKAEDAGEWSKAIDVYGDLLKLEPNNRAFVDKMKMMQKKASESLAADVPREAVLEMAKGIDYSTLKLSAVEGFIFSRVNGQWKVFEILSVVPTPEIEVLAILKKLIDQKILIIKKK